MPPIVSSSKALARLLSSRNRTLDVRSGLGLLRRSSRSLGKSERLAQTRSFSSIARIGNPSIDSFVGSGKEVGPSFGSLPCKSQTRCFLGVGDREEGDVLSKSYEERRVMGYSPEQLFSVVAAVDLYEDFVPWCQRSKILRRNSDGSFDAELEIGFKFLVENYISHVEMKPNYIKSPLYRQVASMFFKEVVSRLVGSFSDRCQRIYGPGVQVLENAYGQGR